MALKRKRLLEGAELAILLATVFSYIQTRELPGWAFVKSFFWMEGFFAALIAGPETVVPSEYLPEVFGGEMSDVCEFGSLDEANGAPCRVVTAVEPSFFEHVAPW